MKNINRFIKEKFLENVSGDNYFLLKKAEQLFKSNVVFLAFMLFLITPVHLVKLEAKPILFVGDLTAIFGLLISFLLLRKGKVSAAGIGTVISYMALPFMHNFIGDWLFPMDAGPIRYLETLVLICFLLVLITTFATDRFQIIAGGVLSTLVISGHFIVLDRIPGSGLSHGYLLYAFLPLAIGIMAFFNLRLVDEAIGALTESRNQALAWNEQLEEMVQLRTKELTESRNKLEAISNTDGLTGIYNRRHFDQALAIEWNRARRSGGQLALVLGDVDRFKAYNDIYGHLAGDECLRLIAGIFKENAQRATDLVARYGGEEFVAIIHLAADGQAIHFAESLMESFRNLNLPHSGSEYGYVTISLGIALAAPNGEQTSEDLLGAADKALYQAKNRGRNQYALWEGGKPL